MLTGDTGLSGSAADLAAATAKSLLMMNSCWICPSLSGSSKPEAWLPSPSSGVIASDPPTAAA